MKYTSWPTIRNHLATTRIRSLFFLLKGQEQKPNCTKLSHGLTFLKWASMSGLLSHISVRRTTEVWRTPVWRNTWIHILCGYCTTMLWKDAVAKKNYYHGSSHSAGFLWLAKTSPSAQAPSWWHELHIGLPVNELVHFKYLFSVPPKK